MENTTKSSGLKNKDKQGRSGEFGRDLARYGLNTEFSKGAIDFIQSNLDEQKRSSEYSRTLHEAILLSADDFATKTEEHHAGGAYAMRTVKETRKKPRAEEKKQGVQEKGWTRGTRDLNYGQRHQENLKSIQDTLNKLEREDDARRQVGQLMSDTEKRVESILKSRSKTMREYHLYKEGQRRGEIGELARSKELENSSDESDTLSLEERSKGQDRLYTMIKERKLQKTSAERRDHLRKQLAVKPKTQTSPTVDTGSMSYESKVAAMRAKDAEQSLSIFGESDEDKKIGPKAEATDSDDYDEKAQIEEEKRKKMEKAVRRRIEQNPAKWEGTGLEGLMQNVTIETSKKKDKKCAKQETKAQPSGKYQNPVEKRKQKNEPNEMKSRQSLFPKSQKEDAGAKNYMNLDGQVMIDSNFNHVRMDGRIDEAMRAGLHHSFQHNMALKKQTESMRENKNKLISASKFFIMKNAQQLSCHHSQNKERIEQDQQQDFSVKIFDRNQQEVPQYKQRSQNLSTFGQQRQAASAEIPLVKDWFKKLSVQERVLCLSTIDSKISNEVKKMFSTLRNQTNDSDGKFQMKVNKSHQTMKMTVNGQQKFSQGFNKPAANWVIIACNSKAHYSVPEVKIKELSLLQMIKLTDTFSLHDTVTVSEELVSNPDHFWSLATIIAGSNYAIEPQRVEWLAEENEFESFAPLWFGMSEPNSLATWLLYFLERALWVQYNNHVYAKYVETKDAQNNSMFVSPESRHISLREEIKPFWRALSENPAQRHEANLAEQLKTKALILFGVMPAPADQAIKDDSKKKVDVFSGGLSIHESSHENKVGDQQPLIDKITAYAKSLDEALDKNQPVPCGMCVDSLVNCSLMHNDEAGNLQILAQRYNLFARFLNAPQQKTASEQMKMAKEWTNVVEMRLDRVFAELIRDYMATKLTVGFTSKNKKLLKKKQKKQLKKELEKEKQRELEAEQEKKDEPAVENEDKIIVKNQQAIDLLMGTSEKDDQKDKKTVLADSILTIQKSHSSQTAMSEKKNRDQVSIQIQTDTSNNYFLWRDSNLESSQQSSTIKTGSTREESQLKNKVRESLRVDQAIINAMSNEEFISKRKNNKEKIDPEEKLNEGNAKFKRQDWQRKEEKKKSTDKQESKGYSEMVNELIDDDSKGRNRHLHSRDQNYKLIDVRVKQGKLHVHKEHLSNDSEGEEEKKHDDGSSSSADESSDQDLLPDLFQKFEPQPHDNDSSDYGAEAVDEDELDAELGEEDEIDDDSSAALSKPQSSQIDNSPKKQARFQDKDKRRSKKKNTAAFSSKKSIKSAHPKMKQHQHLKKENPESNQAINFYIANETTDSNVIDKEDKVAKKLHKKQKPLVLPNLTPIFELLTVTSAEHVQSHEETMTNTNAGKKKKKKNKKAKTDTTEEAEKKEEEEVKQIEIIKPQIEIIRPSKVPAPAVGKKGKQPQQQPVSQQAKPVAPAAKKKKQDAADAMNQFMKSLHSSTLTPSNNKPAIKESSQKESQMVKQDDSVVKKKEDKKTNAASNQAQSASSQQASNGKFQKKPLVHQSNPEQRLSNVEEAQILGSGNYRYEVKGKKVEEDFKEEKKANPASNQTAKKSKDTKKTDVASEEIKPVFKEKKVKEAPTTSGTAFAELKTGIEEDRKSVGKETSIKSQKLSATLDLPSTEASQASASRPEEVNSTASKSSKKPKKQRKNGKKRSEKSKKKTAFQQTYIDPNTGQSVVMDLSLMMQGANTAPQMGQTNATGANDMYTAMNAPTQPQFTPALDMQQQAMQLAQMQMMQQQPNAPFLGFPQASMPNLTLNAPMQHPNQSTQANLQQLLFNLSQSGLIQMAADQYKRQQQEQMAFNQQMMEDTEPCAEEDPDRYDAFYDMLEEEMRAKVKQIEELRDSVHKEREGLISLITLTVKETFASRSGNSYVGIKTFGSSATDLAIETSDVDLVVIGMDVGHHSASRDHKARKEQLIKSMQKLYDCLLPLRDKGQVQSIQLIASANVPIIKLVADLEIINQIQMEKALDKAKQAKLEERRKAKRAKGAQDDDEEESKIVDIDFWHLGIEAKQIDPKMRFLKVDISIDEQGHQQQQLGGKPGPAATRSHGGIETIYHIKELCRQRKDLRPIVMVIKKILDETYLSMPYHGGISSLSLVLMVSAYLKRWDPEQQLALSTNLFGFFHFYGTGFKPELHYLDGDKIETSVNHQQRPFRDAALTIIDPMDRSNNVSHSSFNIHEIQMAFVKAFQIINRACLQFQRCGPIEQMKPHEVDEIVRECQPKRVLELLIERIHQEYYQPSGHYGNDHE